MKIKLFLLCLLGLVLSGQQAFGQKTPKSPKKALTAVLRPPKGKIASLTSGLTDKQLEKMILNLQRKNAALERQLAAQKAAQQKAYSAARKAVFRALGPKAQATTLSGTLFKTTYNGQEEIFGVVPMHVLRNEEHMVGSLSYKFTAGVLMDTTMRFIPAWVVQLSSSKTGDVALVKFRKQDEKFLSPLALHTQELTFPQQAYAQGFANNLLARQSFELIGTTSAGILTAQLPATRRGERAGFCGSPVVGENAQLYGVHIGSEYVADSPDEDAFFSAFQLNRPDVQDGDIGYVAPASFLQHLVAAYHQPKLKPIPVRVAGQEIAHLAVNEYISQIQLLDENYNVVWFKETDYKVSFSAVETVLRLFKNAAYIKLEIGRTHWAKDEQGWHIENTPAVSSGIYPLAK